MKRLLFVSALLILTFNVWAIDPPEKGEKNKETNNEIINRTVTTYKAPKVRTFGDNSWTSVEESVEHDPLDPQDFDQPLEDTLSYYARRALELDDYLKENNRFVEVLDQKTLIDLPVGLKKEIGGLIYTVSIDSIVLTPRSAYLIAYMVFEVPSTGKKLTFRGVNIPITKSGGIVNGDARLELIGDHNMSLFGTQSILRLKGAGNTFVSFDCNGFKSMGVEGEVIFSRDQIVPENADGTVGAGRVTAGFNTTLSNWNDLIAEVSIPNFQIRNLDGVGFTIKNAIFDFSDYRNAPAVTFPEGYQSPALLAGSPELWRGFYLRELSVRLPQQFEKKDGSERTSFAAYDVIIDNMGFTGFLEGKNLIDIDQGNLKGWAYSLDSVGISMVANQLEQAGFDGDILIPIADEENPFYYSALINPGSEYLFHISPTDDLQFDVFKTSKVEIYPASYVDIRISNNRFLPKANLHGQMTINAPLSDTESTQTLNLANIAFEGLQLQSVKPYIRIDAFSFGSPLLDQAMARFPVSINNIGLATLSDTQTALSFDLKVNLNESFGGEASLMVIGNLANESGRQKWKYDKLRLNDILVDIDQGPFKFHGRLQFFRDDREYGNGFNGVLDATFNPGVNVRASAVFGNKSGMRYWYVDALASFPTAIPVVPPFGLTGFGGGAYYRMAIKHDGDINSDLGRTASGIVYTPDERAGLGLKATVAFSVINSESAINGDATFEIAFFRGGGVRNIAFTGNLFALAPPAEGDMLVNISQKTEKMVMEVEKYEQASADGLLPDDDQTIRQIHGEIGASAGRRGSLSAHVRLSVDFENKVLHGNMEMYANVAGGLIRGIGPNGRAGWAVLHYGPDDWYFYLGTPDDRIGISAGVGSIRAEMASYFMAGTRIPSSPPPPEIVSEILGGIDLDYLSDENALGEGKGFGFGSSLAVDTGDLSFLIFYARFQAGLGFDIMLKNYGDDVRCRGRSEPLGVNGWYANGQAYGYFDGKIGVKVKLFGRRKKVEILRISAATVLQAKLPNPFWMRGIVGGRFRVLGGLVKGNCRFQVTIGEECEIVGGSILQSIKVISQVTPNNGDREISVFNTPQAVFNMPVEEVFEMIDTDDKKKAFRIKLDEFKLSDTNNSAIEGELEWNDEHDVVAFNSHDVFPSEQDITAVVQVSFEERVSGGWTPVYVDGQKYVERSEAMFTSGVAPDYIPAENVKYSYPILDQVNFYTGETDRGYIKLKKGQPYLFEASDEWEQKGKFNSSGGTHLFDFNYRSADREVSFRIPDRLSNNQIYKVELVNIPVAGRGNVDRNVSAVTNKVIGEGEAIDAEITTKEAEGTINELQEKSIFSTFVRTSQYNTLQAKLNAADLSQQWRWPIRNGVHELGKAIIIEEVFDDVELNGGPETKPLIQFEAILANNKYYEEYMFPIIYNGYPLENRFNIDWRGTEEMGVPPVRAVFIRQHPQTNLKLTETHISSGDFSFTGLTSAFIYNLSHYYQRDMVNLQNKVANHYADTGGTSARLSYLLTSPFPRILGGPYRVKVKYVLPGKDEVVSEQVITITNPID